MGQVVRLGVSLKRPSGRAAPKPKPTKANEALHPIVMSEEAFCAASLTKHAFYADDHTLILNMDVRAGLKLLAEHNVLANLT